MQAERMIKTLETVLVNLRSFERHPHYYHETERPDDRTRSGYSVHHPNKLVSIPGSRSLEGWVRECSGHTADGVADADKVISLLHAALGCGSAFRPKNLQLEHAIRACDHVRSNLMTEVGSAKQAQLRGAIAAAMMDLARALEAAGLSAHATRCREIAGHPERDLFRNAAYAACLDSFARAARAAGHDPVAQAAEDIASACEWSRFRLPEAWHALDNARNGLAGAAAA